MEIALQDTKSEENISKSLEDPLDFSLRVNLERIAHQSVEIKDGLISFARSITTNELTMILAELSPFLSRDLELAFFLSAGLVFFDERVFSMFSGVVYLDNWSMRFVEFVKRQRAIYPKVKKLKVNNLLNLFTIEELVLFQKTFPNLEHLEYADCGSTEEEQREYRVFFGDHFSTSEDVKKIFGAVAQPFEF